MSEGLTLVDLIESRQKLALLRRQRDIVASNGIVAYRPHKKQDAFHRAGGFRLRYARTGNRFGKSLMGCAEDVAWAIGERPWYRKDDIARSVGIPKRSVKILIIVADWKVAHKNLTNEAEGQARGKLFQLIPASAIVEVKRWHGEINEILVRSIWGGVSSIAITTVKSYKSNKLGAEGSDFDAIHVDEPCPEAMYKAYARGLVDRQGSAWFTCTPVFEMWINDKFQPDSNYREIFDDAYIAAHMEGEYEIKTWMIQGSIHDNPMLSGQAKAEFISQLTDDEKETRIDGRPAMLTGCVYKEFSPSDVSEGGHVHRSAVPEGWKNYITPPEDWCIRVAIDTHPSTPHAVLFSATGPTGHTVFFNEIFERPYMYVLVQQIFARTQDRMPMRSLLEQAAYNKSPFQGAKTLAEEIVEAGLHNVEPAVKDLYFGVLSVQQELSRRDSDGNPFLSFCPGLIRTFREFDRYVWDADKGKPVDKDDHMMENLYRLVISDLTYFDPRGVKARPYKQSITLPQQRFGLPSVSLPALPGFETKKHRRTNRMGDSPRLADGDWTIDAEGKQVPYFVV